MRVKKINMKREMYLLFVVVLLSFIIPLSSAGFLGDFYGKITGKATSGTTTVNVTIGNAAPTVPIVDPIAATDPTIGSTKTITFYFNATDTDGFANINTSTANASFSRAGEPTRYNASCAPVFTPASGNTINFSCQVDMWYFDENGAWTINATIQDINEAVGYNESETFTYNVQTAMVMSPNALSWTGIGVGSTNTGSNENPIVVNNSGNDVNLNINVTSFNLQGNVTTTEFIFANNFTAENITAGCTGTYNTTLSNATSINITSTILQRGNNSLNYNNATSGQEQVYFCLKGVQTTPPISSQGYTSNLYGVWTVEIVT